MPISIMPLKFECSDCHNAYYHHYDQAEHHYPECPQCKKNGMLVGIAESDDVFKHPYNVISSIFKQTLTVLQRA
jgi:NAD-dependent SIR2 family protein deacetylase